MNRDHRRQWRSAVTLAELGELTARWLEGTMPSQPGYMPNSGPDPETKPLIETLARLNRAGFYTTDSQPGHDGAGWDGAHWRQRACVVGYADETTLDWLRAALAGTRFQLLVNTTVTGRRFVDPFGLALAPGIPVTFREHEAVTWFGGQLTRSYISTDIAQGDLCRAAIDLICASYQVTIFDPEFGPNDLWPVLDRATLAC